MAIGQIERAARAGDYDEVLRLSLVKVCALLDATKSGRDGSALFIKIADGVERIEARGGKAARPAEKEAEVTTFEAISAQRGRRRKAATG